MELQKVMQHDEKYSSLLSHKYGHAASSLVTYFFFLSKFKLCCLYV